MNSMIDISKDTQPFLGCVKSFRVESNPVGVNQWPLNRDALLLG